MAILRRFVTLGLFSLAFLDTPASPFLRDAFLSALRPAWALRCALCEPSSIFVLLTFGRTRGKGRDATPVDVHYIPLFSHFYNAIVSSEFKILFCMILSDYYCTDAYVLMYDRFGYR